MSCRTSEEDHLLLRLQTMYIQNLLPVRRLEEQNADSKEKLKKESLAAREHMQELFERLEKLTMLKAKLRQKDLNNELSNGMLDKCLKENEALFIELEGNVSSLVRALEERLSMLKLSGIKLPRQEKFNQLIEALLVAFTSLPSNGYSEIKKTAENLSEIAEIVNNLKELSKIAKETFEAVRDAVTKENMKNLERL